MDLITPAVGTIIWTTIVFVILLIILRAFAWKPILSAVKERQKSIEDSLNEAKLMREKMDNMKAENEIVLREAKAERDSILKEARELKDKIVASAKDEAQIEANKLIESTKQSIITAKEAAMVDIKNQIASLSVDVAERVLRKELDNKPAQEALAKELIDGVKLN